MLWLYHDSSHMMRTLAKFKQPRARANQTQTSSQHNIIQITRASGRTLQKKILSQRKGHHKNHNRAIREAAKTCQFCTFFFVVACRERCMCQRIYSMHASILVWLARTAKGSTSFGTETKLDHSSCLAIHKIRNYIRSGLICTN